MELVRRVTQEIAKFRKEMGITQEALAELLEVPVQHVSRIEAGQNITLATLERITIALGLKVTLLFEPDGEKGKKPPPSKRQTTKARKLSE